MIRNKVSLQLIYMNLRKVITLIILNNIEIKFKTLKLRDLVKKHTEIKKTIYPLNLISKNNLNLI